MLFRKSDLQEVSVHYLQAAGGAQGFPLQGGHSVDGGGGRRRERGRRVRVLLENVLRPRGTLSQTNYIFNSTVRRSGVRVACQ